MQAEYGQTAPRHDKFVNYRELSAMANGHDNQGVIQWNKDGSRLIHATQNGRLPKLFAKLFSNVLGTDLCDKFRIGNENRQKAAAENFFQLLKKKYNFTPKFDIPISILSTQDLIEFLDSSGANSIKDIFSTKDSQLKLHASERIERNFSYFAEIDNYKYLGEESKKALQKVHKIWKDTIDEALMEHGIIPQEINNLLARTIKDSRQLLQEIVNNPKIANIYLDKCTHLKKKLKEFISNNTDPGANVEEVAEDAMELTREFSEFSKWTRQLKNTDVADPSYGECALFPVLQAAVEIKKDVSFSMTLASGGGNSLGAILHASSNYQQHVDNSGSSTQTDIAAQTALDPLFPRCVNLDPIRTCLNVSGLMRGPALSHIPDTPNLSVKLTHMLAHKAWLSSTDKFINNHGNRQELASSHNKFYHYNNMQNSLMAQASFEHCTGLEWESLSLQQKQQSSDFLHHIQKVAIDSGLHVENFLTSLRPLICNVIAQEKFAHEFYTLMSNVKADSRKLVAECLSEKLDPSAAAAKHMSMVQDLAALSSRVAPNPGVETMTHLLIHESINAMKSVEIEKLAQSVLDRNSKLSVFLASCKLAQSQIQAQGGFSPKSLGVAPEIYGEAIDMGILRRLALKAIEHTSSSAKGTETGVNALTDKIWLHAGPLSEQEISTLAVNQQQHTEMVEIAKLISTQQIASLKEK